MLQIAILACLVSTPGDCQVAYLNSPEFASSRQCVMRSMPQIARWGTQHPAYKVVKFKCVRAGQLAFPEAGRQI